MTPASRSTSFLVPGSLNARTGGSLYNRHVVLGLRRRGWSVDVVELAGSFPEPDTAACAAMDTSLRSLDDGSVAIIDGLVFSAAPEVVERHALRLKLVAIVHLPLAEETGLPADVAARLEAFERRALAGASLVIATGQGTLALLKHLGVDSRRARLVPPGTDLAPLARGSKAAKGRVELLSVGSVTPRKGHDVLVRALATVPFDNWHLTIAGSLDRAPVAADALRALISRHGLDDYVSLVGELGQTELEQQYGRADVFVLATRFETYCMAAAEALAHGLPVVGTTTGAIPALVQHEVPAGLVVPPGDEAALADALGRLLGDATLRRELAEGARQARALLPTWDDACRHFEAVVAGLAEHAS